MCVCVCVCVCWGEGAMFDDKLFVNIVYLLFCCRLYEMYVPRAHLRKGARGPAQGSS